MQSFLALPQKYRPIIDHSSHSAIGSSKKAQKLSDISLLEDMRIGPKEMSTSPSLPKAIYKLQPIQKVERQGDTYLRVKIWKQSHYLRKSILRMQICGDPISTSEVLKVENARASDDPVRHKCYQSQRTDSKDIIAWARVLIDQCSEGHELCKARFVADESRSYLPLRLLDVGGSQGDPIKLINRAGLKAELVTYLALSHCWGGPIDAKLNKGSLQDMKTIGVKTLPCNFREAIIVTRGLGERYLWIDSLCIVQDDNQEWEEQSINMGLVYANAKCVLSAAASENSNGGCFRPRDLFRSDCVLRRRWNRALVIRSQERSDLVRLFQSKIESAPLTKRGWTFQEHYLASRILHFGAGVVLFECNKLMASDHDQGKIGQEYSVRQVIRSDGNLHAAEDIDWARRDISKTKVERQLVKVANARQRSFKYETRDVTVMNPDYAYQQATKARLRNDSARLGMRGTFDFLWRYNGTNFAEQIEFHNSWYEMIEHYSSRNLSHFGDKLIAISGVAYFIQQNTNLKYNSGLWEGTIELNMLWTVSGKPKKRQTRPVPTWSWASVDGRVSHLLKEAMPASANEFRSSWQTFESHLSTYIVSATTSETTNGLILNSELHLTGNLWSFRPGLVNVIWDVPSVSQLDLFVLPILSFVNKRVHPTYSKLQLHGIVLRSKSGCIYERVGYFWTANAKAIEQFSGKSPQASQRQTIVLV
jgi:hypothetical protein